MNFKKLTALLICLIVAFSCLAFDVSAATTTIAFSNSEPKVGEKVTVSVTVQGTEAMYSTDFNVSYNPNVLKFESGDSANGGAGSVKIAGLPGGNTKQTYSLTFTALAAGSATISASGGAYYEVADDTVSASATVKVSDVTKSDNANLSALRVSAGTLSPKFSPDVVQYTVNVKNNITECKVYGTTADPDATISIVGSAILKVGENKRVLTVTAPSGAQKSYTIVIVRAAEVSSAPSNTSSIVSTPEVKDPEKEPEKENESELEKEPEEIPAALETVIDGDSYVVLSDLSDVAIPKGFSVTDRLYNNEEISVAVDEKGIYELFFLKQSGSNEAYPYTYDENSDTFTRVLIINQLDKDYIVSEIGEDLKIPNGFTKKTFEIDGMTIEGYVSSDADLEDMYYIYCYTEGEFGIYRYDAKEKVLQRNPEFKLTEIDDTEVDNETEGSNRFAMLSGNAKLIVVCLCIVFLGMIALLVLIIVKFIKRKSYDDFDEDDSFDEDFDSVTFDDDYKIETETEDTEE